MLRRWQIRLGANGTCDCHGHEGGPRVSGMHHSRNHQRRRSPVDSLCGATHCAARLPCHFVGHVDLQRVISMPYRPAVSETQSASPSLALLDIDSEPCGCYADDAGRRARAICMTDGRSNSLEIATLARLDPEHLVVILCGARPALSSAGQPSRHGPAGSSGSSRNPGMSASPGVRRTAHLSLAPGTCGSLSARRRRSAP